MAMLFMLKFLQHFGPGSPPGPQNSTLARRFLQLLKICAVPPVYLEVFLGNNGAYSSFVTYSPGSSTPKELCEFTAVMQPFQQQF
jgi:hypothetical protein